MRPSRLDDDHAARRCPVPRAVAVSLRLRTPDGPVTIASGVPRQRCGSTDAPDCMRRSAYSTSSSRSGSNSAAAMWAGGRPDRSSARAGAAYGATGCEPRWCAHTVVGTSRSCQGVSVKFRCDQVYCRSSRPGSTRPGSQPAHVPASAPPLCPGGRPAPPCASPPDTNPSSATTGALAPLAQVPPDAARDNPDVAAITRVAGNPRPHHLATARRLTERDRSSSPPRRRAAAVAELAATAGAERPGHLVPVHVGRGGTGPPQTSASGWPRSMTPDRTALLDRSPTRTTTGGSVPTAIRIA